MCSTWNVIGIFKNFRQGFEVSLLVIILLPVINIPNQQYL